VKAMPVPVRGRHRRCLGVTVRRVSYFEFASFARRPSRCGGQTRRRPADLKRLRQAVEAKAAWATSRPLRSAPESCPPQCPPRRGG
jgi:hypothetical protein